MVASWTDSDATQAQLNTTLQAVKLRIAATPILTPNKEDILVKYT